MYEIGYSGLELLLLPEKILQTIKVNSKEEVEVLINDMDNCKKAIDKLNPKIDEYSNEYEDLVDDYESFKNKFLKSDAKQENFLTSEFSNLFDEKDLSISKIEEISNFLSTSNWIKDIKPRVDRALMVNRYKSLKEDYKRLPLILDTEDEKDEKIKKILKDLSKNIYKISDISKLLSNKYLEAGTLGIDFIGDYSNITYCKNILKIIDNNLKYMKLSEIEEKIDVLNKKLRNKPKKEHNKLEISEELISVINDILITDDRIKDLITHPNISILQDYFNVASEIENFINKEYSLTSVQERISIAEKLFFNYGITGVIISNRECVVKGYNNCLGDQVVVTKDITPEEERLYKLYRASLLSKKYNIRRG